MKTARSILLLLCTFFTLFLHAQCDFVPTIEGDPNLCPFSTTLLQTQQYDSYQWYRTPWGGQPEPIAGATGQSLIVTEADLLSTISVEVSMDTCQKTAAGVLVDGYVFLLPSVMHTGNYTFDPVSESFVICSGDTMFLNLLMPYEVNITWYRNGVAMGGEVTPLLAVTEEGDYTVEGAPQICPDYIQPLGLTLSVQVEECTSINDPDPATPLFNLFPNPATDHIYAELNTGLTQGNWTILNALGQEVYQQIHDGRHLVPFNLEGHPAGFYYMQWTGSDGSSTAFPFMLIH
ncbi:MAG: T9SS type A sorting domain-containing protein [Saprospiraceae bacterium]|nr:T9SS type A sorting domain-containing protein [Saprospiraceae bacterium]